MKFNLALIHDDDDIVKDNLTIDRIWEDMESLKFAFASCRDRSILKNMTWKRKANFEEYFNIPYNDPYSVSSLCHIVGEVVDFLACLQDETEFHSVPTSKVNLPLIHDKFNFSHTKFHA